MNPIDMQTQNTCKAILSELFTRFNSQLSVKQLYQRLPIFNQQAVRELANEAILTARRPLPSPQHPEKEQPLKNGIDYDPYMPKKLSIQTPNAVPSRQLTNHLTSFRIPVFTKTAGYNRSSSLREPVMLGQKVSSRQSREDNEVKAKQKLLESSLNQMRRLLMKKKKNAEIVPTVTAPKGCPCCMKIRKPPRNFTFDYNGRIMSKTYYHEDLLLVESPLKTNCRKAKIMHKIRQQQILPPSRMQQTPTPQIRRKRRQQFDNGQSRQSSHMPYIQLSKDVTLRENAIWENDRYERETSEGREKQQRRASSTFTHFGLKDKHEDPRLDPENLSFPESSMRYKHGRISVNASLQQQLH